MFGGKVLAALKIIVAAVSIGSVANEIRSGLEGDNFSLLNFFSQFTIQSNLFASVLLVISALLLLKGKENKVVDYLRGAAVVYMLTTAIAFALLLSNIEGITLATIPWDNFFLHYFVPAALLLDWFFDKTSTPISFKQGLVWLAYPIVFLVVTMVRGAISGFYPYPFLDPSQTSYPKIGVIIAGIIALILVFTFLITRFGKQKTA